MIPRSYVVGILILTLLIGVGRLLAQSTTPKVPAPPVKRSASPDKPLELPASWNKNDPLPEEKTNCVRCHLTAGKELTAPVREFARSVHDFAKLSCNDCHGGDIEHDATAHEPEHGFIGTKMSAHIAACASCHTREAQGVQKGKHYWDLSRGINRRFPVCIDCHGNHDIGKPPAEFALTNVCTDCHKQFARDLPGDARVAADNDKLWQLLRKVQDKNQKAKEPIPAEFQREVTRVRSATARLMHRARPVTAAEAQALSQQVTKLSDELEAWLKKHP